MRDQFTGLGSGQAVVHGLVEMEGDLRRLATRNKRGNRDEAAVPGCQVRPQPQVAEQWVGREMG